MGRRIKVSGKTERSRAGTGASGAHAMNDFTGNDDQEYWGVDDVIMGHGPAIISDDSPTIRGEGPPVTYSDHGPEYWYASKESS